MLLHSISASLPARFLVPVRGKPGAGAIVIGVKNPIKCARMASGDQIIDKNPAAQAQSPEIASIRASVLQPLRGYFGQNSGRLRALLTRHGLGPDLPQDPYARLPLKAYLGLFEDAAALTGDPILGAKLGYAARPGDLGPVGMLVAQAGSIRQALNAFARFTGALQTTTNAVLHELEDMLVLSYRIDAGAGLARRQDSEFSLAVICGLIRTSFNARWCPAEIHFEHSSIGKDAALEKLFGARIRFGQATNRILVHATEANLQWRQEDRDLILMIERHLGDLIATGGSGASMAEQVQALIRLYMGVRPMDLESLAAGLKLPPRSLQRRLAEEGKSVRELVQRHRLQMANTLLCESGVSIEAIAVALGYADGTAFWRAYKQWTGNAPSRFSRHDPPPPPARRNPGA